MRFLLEETEKGNMKENVAEEKLTNLRSVGVHPGGWREVLLG